MRLSQIEANTLPEAWFLCLKEVLDNGYDYVIDKGSFAEHQRRELDFITVRIKHPDTMPLVPDVPLGVTPPSTMDYVQQYLPYLMTNKPEPREQYTYGQYLESQIARVIDVYKKFGPNNNQLCMRVGDMHSMELDDPPCLMSIDTRIRYEALHFTVAFRSWDLWAGFPSNLAAIEMLKQYMASEIGVNNGEIIATSKGLHLYDYSWPFARIVTGVKSAFH